MEACRESLRGLNWVQGDRDRNKRLRSARRRQAQNAPLPPAQHAPLRAPPPLDQPLLSDWQLLHSLSHNRHLLLEGHGPAGQGRRSWSWRKSLSTSDRAPITTLDTAASLHSHFMRSHCQPQAHILTAAHLLPLRTCTADRLPPLSALTSAAEGWTSHCSHSMDVSLGAETCAAQHPLRSRLCSQQSGLQPRHPSCSLAAQPGRPKQAATLAAEHPAHLASRRG